MLAPEPSFVMYRMNALYAGARFVGVPLAPDFALDAAAMLAAIEREQPALVFLAYPNNPTGNLFAREAYRGASCARRPGSSSSTRRTTRSPARASCRALREFPNLVVLRTVSKIGMAGLRLGYAVAAPGVDGGIRTRCASLTISTR